MFTPFDIQRYREIAAEFQRLADLPEAQMQEAALRLKRYAAAIEGNLEGGRPTPMAEAEAKREPVAG